MKFGAGLPQYERGTDPDRYREYAKTAEELGYQHLLAFDHVLGVNPERDAYYTSGRPLHEPLVLFGYLAGVTEEIKLATGILILPQRQTALVAKQAAEADVLSDGRVRLGVGVGWNEIEYEALGEDFHTRGRRMEAQVDVLRKLWAEEAIEVDDRWHSIPDAGINPRPVDGEVPIWMGGGADPVLERTARTADGWVLPGQSFDELEGKMERLEGYLEEAGRDRTDLALVGRMDASEGGPEEWVEEAREWREFGATHVTVHPFGADVGLEERLEEFIGAMEDSDVPVES